MDVIDIFLPETDYFRYCKENTNMNSYEEMYEDAEVTPDGSNARLKPHAQIHLLSPTDKCKVNPTPVIADFV